MSSTQLVNRTVKTHIGIYTVTDQEAVDFKVKD